MSEVVHAQASPVQTLEPASVAKAVVQLCARTERADLVERIELANERHANQSCRVVIVGEFKMGKSSLMNSIVNAPLSPTDDDVATAKPLEVHYAEEPTASVVYRLGEDEDTPRVREIAIEDVESYVLEPPTAPDSDQCALVRIGLPRKLFSGGMSLIDTPGVGGIGSMHAARTLGVLPMADAVLFVSDAAQELSAPELEFLDMVREICPTVAMVMPKVDFYAHWRHIEDLNDGHLTSRGIEMESFPISSTLRKIAIAQNNQALNEESGYKSLVEHLRADIEDTVSARNRSSYLTTIDETLRDLRSQLQSEFDILNDPEAADSRMAELEAQRDQAEALRGRAARWQQTLYDGVADLNSDIEHDLRLRFRELIKDTEARLDEEDPAKMWDDFTASTTNEVNRAISQNFAMLHQRSVELAEEVATHFSEDQAQIVSASLSFSSPTDVAAAPKFEDAAISDRPSVLGSGVNALRGSIGGFVMVGIIGTAVSVTPAAWVAPVVAALIGRKTRRDEAIRALEKRQREAKAVMRKYIDEAQFMAVRDVRDSIRLINRQQRDFYLEKAEEVKRSTNETLAAAKAAMQTTAADRKKRIVELDKVLKSIDQLHGQLLALDAPAQP